MIMTDLPEDILTIMLGNIARQVVRANMSCPLLAVKKLGRLSATSRVFKTIIDREMWKVAWDTFIEGNEKLRLVDATDPKHCLLLYSMHGCQFCKTPRVHKVYTAFQVRCCKSCLYERTISDYSLKSTYLVSVCSLQDLPFITTELWNRQVGSYSLNFYWILDVESKIGNSLDEYYQLEKAHMEIAESNKKKRFMEDLSSGVFELALTPPFNSLSTEFIQSHLASYNIVYGSSTCTALAILKSAFQSWNTKLLDDLLKKHTRRHNVSIVAVRKTSVYKSKLLVPFAEFTDEEWDLLKRQIFTNVITSLLDRRPIGDLQYSESYVNFAKTLHVPTKSEWSEILFEIEQYKQLVISPSVLMKKGSHIPCPHCLSSSRKFECRGLQNHILSFHFYKHFWPNQ